MVRALSQDEDGENRQYLFHKNGKLIDHHHEHKQLILRLVDISPP